MKIVEVTKPSQIKAFHSIVKDIYANDSNYIFPLVSQIEKIFSPKHNPEFTNGDAKRWLVYSDEHKLIGRIAAFYSKNKNSKDQLPIGGIGFFECHENQMAADLLFETAKEWLKEKGLEGMDGPINFGENDTFWGLLVDGFTQPGFGMNYNPPYYKNLFENFGFNFYYEQVSHHLDLIKPFPERFWRIAEWLIERGTYRFEHFRYTNIEKYLNDFIDIHKEAWKFHPNYSPLIRDEIKARLEEMKPITPEDFIWFAYHGNDPAGVMVMVPDFNQLLAHIKGRMNIFSKLKLYFLKKRKTIRKARVIMLGVKPRYQRAGVESGIFYQVKQTLEKYPEYNELELSWVGEFNPKMKALLDDFGSRPDKKHFTYRYLFDTNNEVKPLATIPVDTKEYDY